MKIPSPEQLTAELIAIPSVTHDHEQCKAILEHVESYLKDLPDVSVRHYESGGHRSMVAVYKADKEPDILLSAHLDVVDAPQELFTPHVSDGCLYGRGAYDMKGGAAVLICTFMHHAQSDSPVSVGLMLTTDEEIGGRNGVGYLLQQVGYRCTCCVLPDGGGPDYALVHTQLGILWARIERRGKTAHGSTPNKGENAILTFMNDFQKFEKRLASIPETTVNLSSVSGSGKAFNMVADLCAAGLDIRSPQPSLVMPLLNEFFGEENIDIIEKHDACSIATDHPYFTLFHQCAEEVLQKPMPIVLERGSSDARFFPEYGTPVIIASGKGGGLHQDKEWIEIESLHNMQKMISMFIGKMESHLLQKQMKTGSVHT